VFGDGSVLYWTLQISTLLILVLAANTAFSGFPRLAVMLAEDHCLPMQMKLLDPFCDFVMEQEQRHPKRTTTVVMPVAIPRDRLDVALLIQRARSLFEELSTDQSRVFSIVRYFVPRLVTKAGTLPSGSMD